MMEGTCNATFTYNANNQRAKMAVLNGSNLVLNRWYPNSSFIKDSTSGVSKTYTFIGGNAYTAPVVAVKQNNGTPTYYYLLRDHLGSITHVVNTSNSVVAEYSYDAWGRMRNPTTWANDAPGQDDLMIADRGFTGHEHLKWFKFINMNGRMYDPLVGQFLSPDNYVQAPGFTQSYNRFGYCLNNPLKYTDPSGEYAFLQWIVGGVIGGIMNVWQNDRAGNIDNFKDWFVYYNIGNVAGSTGAAAGSLVDKGLGNYFGIKGGILGGSIIGGSGGFVGGFLQETLNSLYGGESINDAVDAGWSAGKKGAGWGAAIGGLTGGWDAYRDGRNIWTGQQKVEVYLRSDGRPVPDVHNDNIMESMHNSSDWTEGEKAYYDKLYNQIGFTESNAYPSELNIDVPNYVRVTDVQVNRYGFLPNQKFNISVNGQSPISLSKIPGNDIWYNVPIKNVQSLRMWVSGQMINQSLSEIVVNVPHRTLIHGFYWTPLLHFF